MAQRILDPAQIEDFAHREIPRIRLPDASRSFAERASRLRELAQAGRVGHSIGDYLRLMATMADGQQRALAQLTIPAPSAERLERSHGHRMPLLSAADLEHEPAWRRALHVLCDALLDERSAPAKVHAICKELCAASEAELGARARALLTARTAGVDTATAPFVMGALQVLAVALASRLERAQVRALDVPGICPVCGTVPVASVVRVDRESSGYRYLYCALCATEWHLVRITCSQCFATKGLTYHTIEGGPEAIRAESCDRCRTYRKILYQEKDTGVEPVADDLASVALDLLLSEAGYQRASGNPLNWL